MVDITHKKVSLREATATAILFCSLSASIDAIKNKTVPKGDVLEMAKTAGLFAVKKTADMIPDCHPIPVENTVISYKVINQEIHISVTVKAIYRTGMEVEAMHGASVVALTMYDMLKPIDKGIEIRNIKLKHKSGGKSDIKKILPKNITASVLTFNKDQKKLEFDENVKSVLTKFDIHTNVCERIKSTDLISEQIQESIQKNCNLILVFGGTGLSDSDQTIEYVRPLLDRELPSLTNLLMSYGIERTFKSLVSQPLSGTIAKSIVICLPGSTNGAMESLTAIVPEVLYLFKSLNFNT